MNVITFPEMEEEWAEFKHMYVPRSLAPIIDTDKFSLTSKTFTQARAGLSSICLSSVRVPRRPSPLQLVLKLVDSEWSRKIRSVDFFCVVLMLPHR